jgi:hypothetical protein
VINALAVNKKTEEKEKEAILHVLEEFVSATNVDETVLGETEVLDQTRVDNVQLGPEGTEVLGLETLPERQEFVELLKVLHVIVRMDFELKLGEGQDLKLIHHGVEGCKFVTLNIDLENIDPIVSVLLHNTLERLPGVAVRNLVLAANKVLEEMDVGVTSGI